MTTRYHPLLVALHWLLAALIVLALIGGSQSLAPTPNDDPAKVSALAAHMTVGIAILVLMFVRLGVRLRAPAPAAADIGHSGLNRLAHAAHWLFYLLVFAMVASGIGLSLLAGLPDIVFGGSGAPLPEDFSVYTPRIVHGTVATLLGLMILGHVAAAIYHQVVRKDRLMRRMWFGRRDA